MEVVIRMLDGSIPYHLTGLIPPPRDVASGRDRLSCSDSACVDAPALTDRPRPSGSRRRRSFFASALAGRGSVGARRPPAPGPGRLESDLVRSAVGFREHDCSNPAPLL